MRVLFTSLRTTSHFLPLVPFLEACKLRGHEVAVAAPNELAERVAATGARFFPVGHPGDEGLRPIWQRLASAPDEEKNGLVIGEIFAGASAGAALPELLSVMKTWRPSIVLRESQEYAAVVAAAKLDISVARVAIMARGTEVPLLPIAAPWLDAHGSSVGLPPDPSGERIKREPALTLFPVSFDPAEAKPPASLRFRVKRKPPPALPDWWAGAEGPLLYATLGTVAGGMERMRAAYRVVLEAVVGLPIRVLLTVGADLPLDMLGEVPLNVRVERFIPQDDVLPHAAAIVCHGGSGTVLGALGAGVPMVVCPMFADQPFNAERVVAIGAGLALATFAATADTLRQAVLRVLEEASFRHHAQRLAAEIAGLPCVDEAGAALERLASQ